MLLEVMLLSQAHESLLNSKAQQIRYMML